MVKLVFFESGKQAVFLLQKRNTVEPAINAVSDDDARNGTQHLQNWMILEYHVREIRDQREQRNRDQHFAKQAVIETGLGATCAGFFGR